MRTWQQIHKCQTTKKRHGQHHGINDKKNTCQLLVFLASAQNKITKDHEFVNSRDHDQNHTAKRHRGSPSLFHSVQASWWSWKHQDCVNIAKFELFQSCIKRTAKSICAQQPGSLHNIKREVRSICRRFFFFWNLKCVHGDARSICKQSFPHKYSRMSTDEVRRICKHCFSHWHLKDVYGRGAEKGLERRVPVYPHSNFCGSHITIPIFHMSQQEGILKNIDPNVFPNSSIWEVSRGLNTNFDSNCI